MKWAVFVESIVNWDVEGPSTRRGGWQNKFIIEFLDEADVNIVNISYGVLFLLREK